MVAYLVGMMVVTTVVLLGFHWVVLKAVLTVASTVVSTVASTVALSAVGKDALLVVRKVE